MDPRLASLLQCQCELSRIEYRVLSWIGNNAGQLEGMTVRQLAETTYVSAATIVRLCQKLGFSGYSELLFSVRQRLSQKIVLPGASQGAAHLNMSASLEQFVENYRKTLTYIAPEQITAFINLLCDKKTLFVYGVGASHLMAEYLTKKLQLLGKTVLLSGLNDSKAIFLNNAELYQIFIAISRSGETQQLLEKAQIARNIGLPVISFTHASFNALAQLSDIHFQIHDDAGGINDSGKLTSFESNVILLIDLLLLSAMQQN